MYKKQKEKKKWLKISCIGQKYTEVTVCTETAQQTTIPSLISGAIMFSHKIVAWKKQKKTACKHLQRCKFLAGKQLTYGGGVFLFVYLYIYLFILICSCVHSPKHRNQIVLWHHQRDGTNFRYIEDFPDFKIESPVGFLPKGKYNGLAEGLDTNLHRIQSKVTLYCWQPLGAGKNCVLPNQFVSSCWMLLGVARWQISRHNFPEHVCYGASVRWFFYFSPQKHNWRSEHHCQTLFGYLSWIDWGPFQFFRSIMTVPLGIMCWTCPQLKLYIHICPYLRVQLVPRILTIPESAATFLIFLTRWCAFLLEHNWWTKPSCQSWALKEAFLIRCSVALGNFYVPYLEY